MLKQNEIEVLLANGSYLWKKWNGHLRQSYAAGEIMVGGDVKHLREGGFLAKNRPSSPQRWRI